MIACEGARKVLVLERPFAEADEVHVRGRIVKAVGRPADVYSIGALFYYLITGATGNPKALFDSFKRFAEYDKDDDTNTVTAYIEHEYRRIHAIGAPKPGTHDVAFADRFFSCKQYLDGNAELIDPQIMLVIVKAMIRNKADSYCLSYDLESTGISAMVHDLLALYVAVGVDPSARFAHAAKFRPVRRSGPARRTLDKLLGRSS